MNNFLDFIKEDIEAKKTLFSTMPTNTKANIKKYNAKIMDVTEKYEDYKARVKKYINVKSKSFDIKTNTQSIEKLSKDVRNLERVRFILNPLNTFFEKMGFDNLLYEISNYYDFNFCSLNEIINNFFDKFEMAGIKLSTYDFDYTCYVNEYMASFLEERSRTIQNYDKVCDIFENIYWLNPDIIQHIELNFRKLIKKHEKKFVSYIARLQKEIMLEHKVSSFQDCISKLKNAYLRLDTAEKENISDIINLAKNGSIDINSYFENSKVRINAYNSLAIDSSLLEDKEKRSNFHEDLEKLKFTIEEYDNYMKFIPLINDFKNEYVKQILHNDKNSSNNRNKGLKNIETQISQKEAKLDKLNKKIFTGKLGFFESKNNFTIKQLKIDSVKLAKSLYDLYKIFDQECFKCKILSVLNPSMTIAELLYLYYSFDYFKKIAIKRVFNINNYEEIVKYSDSFDLFAMNPTNIVVKGVLLFEENNIGKVIMNKYRLHNINITEESLAHDDLGLLLDKIQLLLRINEIENSPTTVEKIWFMTQVERLNTQESKNN